MPDSFDGLLAKVSQAELSRYLAGRHLMSSADGEVSGPVCEGVGANHSVARQAAAAGHRAPDGRDLDAPMEPSHTYRRPPTPESSHASIFGDPHRATAQSGRAFIEASLEALVNMMENLQASYEKRGTR